MEETAVSQDGADRTQRSRRSAKMKLDPGLMQWGEVAGEGPAGRLVMSGEISNTGQQSTALIRFLWQEHGVGAV